MKGLVSKGCGLSCFCGGGTSVAAAAAAAASGDLDLQAKDFCTPAQGNRPVQSTCSGLASLFVRRGLWKAGYAGPTRVAVRLRVLSVAASVLPLVLNAKEIVYEYVPKLKAENMQGILLLQALSVCLAFFGGSGTIAPLPTSPFQPPAHLCGPPSLSLFCPDPI